VSLIASRFQVDLQGKDLATYRGNDILNLNLVSGSYFERVAKRNKFPDSDTEKSRQRSFETTFENPQCVWVVEIRRLVEFWKLFGTRSSAGTAPVCEVNDEFATSPISSCLLSVIQ
jgi:hypothetical protein